MDSFNSQLRGACEAVAKIVVMHAAVPHSSNYSETLAAIEQDAMSYVGMLENRGQDPAIVTRAMLYLANVHVFPSTEPTVETFRIMLETLMQLASPTAKPSKEAKPFLEDIKRGIDMVGS